jgi:hypothetical protein
MYTDIERRSALLHQGEVNPEYILPIRMDDSEVHLSLRGIAYIDRKKIKISEIVSHLKRKLGSNTDKDEERSAI